MTRLNLRRCGSLLSAQALLAELRESPWDSVCYGCRSGHGQSTIVSGGAVVHVTLHGQSFCEAARGKAVLARIQKRISDEIANCCKFVNADRNVMLGPDRVAVATSRTMAKRIARALNNHKPNREGV